MKIMKTIDWLFDTLPVIVLYNTTLADSVTFQSLKKVVSFYRLPERINIMVCDNSPTPQVTMDYIQQEKLFTIHYLHDAQNPGVSRSYNRGARLAERLHKRWLLLLDQDTVLPANFLPQYQTALQKYPNYPLYAPQLYSGTALFSPCRYAFGKGSNLHHIESGVHTMTHRNVLNSGLLIQLDAFKAVGGYDEKVKLYFSDFAFFERLKRVYRKFVVIGCQLEHQLSSVDYSDHSFALKRFSLYCKGARQTSRGNLLAYLNQAITVGLRSVLMSWRFKSLQFFSAFFQSFVYESSVERSFSRTYTNENLVILHSL